MKGESESLRSRLGGRTRSVSLALVAAAALGLWSAGVASGKLDRPADPVVVSGSQTPSLLGADPDRVVAFKLSGRRRWLQIPVQVDERRRVDLGDVYAGTRPGIEIDAYADPGTLTGADPAPTLDGDDEIALMARHAGPRRGLKRFRGLPRRLQKRPSVELRLTDPDSGERRWAYLFDSRGTRLDPAAGRDLVSYRFRLSSGDYPSTYEFSDGPNPETSVVESRSYRLRFTDRWISDVLEITRPGTETADLLDRRKVQFGPGVCGRSTDTFTEAEGAFVTNVDGPVRAIRSYVGANSGPMTQREHLFYDRREEITTFLRVHSIPGVMDFLDFVPTPRPMRYRSSTTAAVAVDGVADALPSAPAEWEQLTGPHGTLTTLGRVETDVEGLAFSAYYLDDSTPDQPDQAQCTGDALAWGSSGLRIEGPIANTDPLRGPAAELRGLRTIFYDGPGLKRRDAVLRAGWVSEPLRVRATGRPPRRR